MIQDYQKGSGLKGALDSLLGERVIAVLSGDNTITIFFESKCAVAIHAQDYAAMVVLPLNIDTTLAYVKTLVRDTKILQANLSRAIIELAKCKTDEDLLAYDTTKVWARTSAGESDQARKVSRAFRRLSG